MITISINELEMKRNLNADLLKIKESCKNYSFIIDYRGVKYYNFQLKIF